MKCSICGQELDTRWNRYWTKVEGWEHPRASGGTNHIVFRKSLNEFMCETCMVALREGVDPRQQNLLR